MNARGRAALKTALTPQTRARARAVAGTIRADGATVAAKLLLDAVSRDRAPVSASRLPRATAASDLGSELMP